MAQSVRQAAAIPILDGSLCLVSSSSGRRWVIPKGMIEIGETAGETALKETWEEAGLSGVLHGEPTGSYVYEKYNTLHHVTVFLMQVSEVHDVWPESHRRERRWCTPSDAIELIEEEGLRELIELYARSQIRIRPRSIISG
jgi:8-oxo-dGTP pyrophosphatase MutT (NUDIX family)